ncbi:MAG: hypothetical protein UT24_C0024G0001 [Candidatus Woesebacteria bacterium GW2011_GWB1_39_12]|uniref:Uncharacterized protein n=1 Tax=Candidatus Woesebacteria bacterium GW2011_GWB1_39_12 TaxID=1618574 RepID=A0A0G0QCC1_9BACT|nr:MAG: hypothetical protein UT24_C0024G0001 [Candidatus Woesebacteria bacterium GW2011_GWB1_39_12]
MIILLGVGLAVFGAFFIQQFDQQTLEWGSGLGMILTGGVISGMVFGVLFKSDNWGKSLVQPISQ